MKRGIFLIIILLFGINVCAQNWNSLGSGLSFYGNILYNDTLTNKLFIGGAFAKVNGHYANGIAAWDGNNWDTLDGGIGCCNAGTQPIHSIMRFQDSIYVGGLFNYLYRNPDGEQAHGFTRWNGTSWDSLNSAFHSLGHPWNFCIFNNLLYCIGDFENVDNIFSPGVVAWNGTTWIPNGIPHYSTLQSGAPNVCCVFQNELYIAGNFADSTGNLIGCAKFDGANWTEVGMGGGGLVKSMVVYNNELYIGGQYIGLNSKNLVKYDGVNFIDIDLYAGDVMNIRVLDDKLFVVGYIDSVSSIVIHDNIAVWDGNNWSDFSNDTFNNGVGDIVVFNNDLYVTGAFTMINSDTINYVAKYSGWFVGENNLESKFPICVYPNPVSSILTIHNQSALSNYELAIKNVLGQEVYSQQINNSKNPTIDVSH